MNEPKPFGGYKPPAPQYRGWKSSHRYVTLRDGVRLATEVVLPRGVPRGTCLPALLQQTRYWRAVELRRPWRWFLSGEDVSPDLRRFNRFFTSRGYALVNVDVRGTGASFGTWPYPWPTKSIEDAREVVDWIVEQPWSNGRVGGYGISYMGLTAELLTVLDHPAIQAVIPQFNHPDPFIDIAYPGGVLNDRMIREWGRMDSTLDDSRVPRQFGILGKLFVSGVRPVDGADGRALLAEAVAAHAANCNVYALLRDVVCRDERDPDLDMCVDDIAIHRYQTSIDRAAVPQLGWASWMDAGTADAALRRFLSNGHAGRAVIGAWEHGGHR
jgi:putative CocE/NonD family hydrolase